jgi:hypothetical protein
MIPLYLLLPLCGGANVDISLVGNPASVPTGCIAEVDLVLTPVAPTTVVAVDVILSWNPAQLEFVQALPAGGSWLASGFLNDPDGINDDVRDGEAIYTLLVNPANPLALAASSVVATFEFRAHLDGAVGMLANSGIFGSTGVYGTTPGVALTGALAAPAAITAVDVPALELPRLGTPPNPNVFKPGITSGPVIGSIWDPFVDHSAFFPAALFDVIGITPLQSPVDVPTPWGVLLCDISGVLRLHFRPAGFPFAVPVPFKCELVGVNVCTQAASFDAVDVLLTNALDLTIGTF